MSTETGFAVPIEEVEQADAHAMRKPLFRLKQEQEPVPPGLLCEFQLAGSDARFRRIPNGGPNTTWGMHWFPDGQYTGPTDQADAERQLLTAWRDKLATAVAEIDALLEGGHL